MNEPTPIPDSILTRRSFLKSSSAAVAGAALANLSVERLAHAAATDELKIALIGCGGRGSGAADQALNTHGQGPVKLVAMADAFEDRLKGSLNGLKRKHGDRVDVPADRQFVGFDGYKQAISLADVVILATPPAFRWVHFGYAIQKGLHTFMEKPTTVDGPTTKRMLDLAEQSEKKNLKVAVGLMCRHCLARKELYQRIKDGQIGDITLLRAYRMAGPTGSAFARKNSGSFASRVANARSSAAFGEPPPSAFTYEGGPPQIPRFGSLHVMGPPHA